MANLRAKWRLIKKILHNDESIVIFLNNEMDNFDYDWVGNSIMFENLYKRLISYVPKWYSMWCINGNRKIVK